MAIVEMKAILAALIANFEFRPTYEGQVAKPAAAITMSELPGDKELRDETDHLQNLLMACHSVFVASPTSRSPT